MKSKLKRELNGWRDAWKDFWKMAPGREVEDQGRRGERVFWV
jgi:hypothetical protein